MVGKREERERRSRASNQVFNTLNWNINDCVGGKLVGDAIATRNIAFNSTATCALFAVGHREHLDSKIG